ncbi:MAG: Uma2 family endonuclease [Planctomycetaceae bacterium]|nr:Uma2 family endonuclease [Planctomycetaceae bacterium]
MSTAQKRHCTPKEYLEFERNSQFKHQYYKGEIFAMGGASFAHGQLVSNLTTLFGIHFKDSDCQAIPKDLRVKADKTGLYTYPDLTVVCGEPEFEDDVFDTLLNPKLMIEVLSDSTEAFDRGEKFAQYRTIDPFEQYALISQREYRIEVFTRVGDGRWVLSEAAGVDSTIEFSTIQCSLKLRDVYERVTIPFQSEKPTK